MSISWRYLFPFLNTRNGKRQEYIWLWIVVDIESKDKEIFGISTSKERNMFVAIGRFLSCIIDEYGRHTVSTDGDGTWYLHQTCNF